MEFLYELCDKALQFALEHDGLFIYDTYRDTLKSTPEIVDFTQTHNGESVFNELFREALMEQTESIFNGYGYVLTPKGERFILNGGYAEKFLQQAIKEKEKEHEKQLSKLVSQSVVDTNRNQQRTNRNTLIVAVVALVVSVVPLAYHFLDILSHNGETRKGAAGQSKENRIPYFGGESSKNDSVFSDSLNQNFKGEGRIDTMAEKGTSPK